MDFQDVVYVRVEKIQTILGQKAEEYATDSDRYHNFNVAARMNDTTPEKALKGMMLKHEVSVNDLIEWADTSPKKLTLELIEEKIGDNINYLILLEGMLKERIAKQPRDLSECIQEMEKGYAYGR